MCIIMETGNKQADSNRKTQSKALIKWVLCKQQQQYDNNDVGLNLHNISTGRKSSSESRLPSIVNEEVNNMDMDDCQSSRGSMLLNWLGNNKKGYKIQQRRSSFSHDSAYQSDTSSAIEYYKPPTRFPKIKQYNDYITNQQRHIQVTPDMYPLHKYSLSPRRINLYPIKSCPELNYKPKYASETKKAAPSAVKGNWLLSDEPAPEKCPFGASKALVKIHRTKVIHAPAFDEYKKYAGEEYDDSSGEEEEKPQKKKKHKNKQRSESRESNYDSGNQSDSKKSEKKRKKDKKKESQDNESDNESKRKHNNDKKKNLEDNESDQEMTKQHKRDKKKNLEDSESDKEKKKKHKKNKKKEIEDSESENERKKKHKKDKKKEIEDSESENERKKKHKKDKKKEIEDSESENERKKKHKKDKKKKFEENEGNGSDKDSKKHKTAEDCASDEACDKKHKKDNSLKKDKSKDKKDKKDRTEDNSDNEKSLDEEIAEKKHKKHKHKDKKKKKEDMDDKDKPSVSTDDRPSSVASSIIDDMVDVDDYLFQKLKRKQKKDGLSEKEFRKLLKKYWQKKKGQTENEDETNMEDKVTEILENSKKDKEQIYGLRKAEQDKVTDKLKQKLEAKKKKKKSKKHKEDRSDDEDT